MSQGDTKLITQAQYARQRGCSRQAVSVAVQTGRISAFGPDRRVNAALADQQWPRSERPSPNEPGPTAAPEDADPDAGGPAYRVSRARREAAQADLAELELARQRGDVVLASKIAGAVEDAGTMLRIRLESLPDQLAATLAHESDEHRVRALLADGVEAALSDLAKRFAEISRLAL